nr:hypothetical protein [Tanacetum cinerariifolium]
MGHYNWDVIGGTSLWWDTRGGTTKVKHQSEGDDFLDIERVIRERAYYPWLHYGNYDHYYFSTCDDARCSFHDIYVENVVTSRHLSYLRSVLTPSMEDFS